MAAFHFDQERALWELHEELAAKTYQPGAYRSFFIYEPKKRQISASSYRDRVVHHALTGVLESIFEPTFIWKSCGIVYPGRSVHTRRIAQSTTGKAWPLEPRPT